MKKIITSLCVISGLIVNFELLQPTAVTADSALITDTWGSNVYGYTIVYGTHENGSMIMAYHENDRADGVYLYQYLPESGEWLDVQFLPNPTVAGEDHATIQDLTIANLAAVPGNSDDISIFMVYWISNHHSTTGEFIESNYNLYQVAMSGGTYQIETVDSTATKDEQAVFHVQPAGGDSMYGFWSNDGILYAEHWTAQDEWSESVAGSMAALATPDDFSTITANGKEYIFSDSSGDVKGGVLKAPCCDTVTFTNTFTVADDAELINLTPDADDNIYILYKLAGAIRRKILNTSDNTLSDEVIVINAVGYYNDLTVAYNGYGKGQYIVLLSAYVDTYNYDLIYSVEHGTTWEGNMVATEKNAYALQIHTLANGHIQFVWRNLYNTWYEKKYSPQTKTWSEVHKVKKYYGGQRLMNPLKQAGVHTSDGQYYIERFRTKHNGQTQQILRRWNLNTAIKGTTTHKLPAGYQRIYHAVNGDYHFIIIQQNSVIKSMIAPETDLFVE